jgi:hypothetical protein
LCADAEYLCTAGSDNEIAVVDLNNLQVLALAMTRGAYSVTDVPPPVHTQVVNVLRDSTASVRSVRVSLNTVISGAFDGSIRLCASARSPSQTVV